MLRGDWRTADVALAAGFAATKGGSEPPTTLLLHCLQAQSASVARRPTAAARAAGGLRAQARSVPASEFLADVVERALTDADLAQVGRAATAQQPSRAGSATSVSGTARRLLASGQPAAARAMAAAVTDLSQPETLLEMLAVIDAWLVSALAHDHDGGSVAARACLRRAVGLAGPQRIAAPFLTAGSPRVLPLLQQLAPPLQGVDPFVADLIARLGGPAPSQPPPAPLLEPLTGRDLAMLQELTSLKSNPEIAADSYMSVNTVKAHLKDLYRKLGVSRRREAVERARDLGLLP